MASHSIFVRRFSITGFPIDMLRRENLYPAGPEASQIIMDTFDESFRLDKPIRLITRQSIDWKPNKKEWTGHGWNVVGHVVVIGE